MQNDNVIQANPRKISQSEIENLRKQVDDQKRLMEYQQLKKDLQDISFQTANTPNEYDSAMCSGSG